MASTLDLAIGVGEGGLEGRKRDQDSRARPRGREEDKQDGLMAGLYRNEKFRAGGRVR